MEISTPDAIHKFPFSAAIAAHMRQLPGIIDFGSLSDVRVREAGEELIIEATGHHRRVSDGTARDIDYVWFLTLRDGKVAHIRDYMNPLQLAAL